MGCDVYLFKVDQAKLVTKFAESADLKASFDDYVTQNNIKYERITWSKLDAKEILLKLATDFDQLSRDEFWEILMWLNYSTAADPAWGLQFEDEKVEAKLNEFGFNLIEDFQDNTRVFLFAMGDFLDQVFNDMCDETRKYASLTNVEFNLFLDYVRYLYATVLIGTAEESGYSLELDDLSEIINKSSKDSLLKRLVAEKSEEIISTKSREPDGMVFGTFNRLVYAGDFDQAIYRCQLLKEQLKENTYPIIILDSQ